MRDSRTFLGESREWGHLVGMADPRWDDYCLPDELFEHIHELYGVQYDDWGGPNDDEYTCVP